MSTRKLLAAGSTLLIALRLLAGPGGGTADRLWRAGAAGLAEAARTHDASVVSAADAVEPLPTPAPESTPLPQESSAPEAVDAAVPTTAPDGRAILPTTLTGGMTMKNETDFSPDLAALHAHERGLYARRHRPLHRLRHGAHGGSQL